jgi:hypothetical protein
MLTLLLTLLFLSNVRAKEFIVFDNPECHDITPTLGEKCLERKDSTLLYHQVLLVKKSNIGLWNINDYLISIKSWYLTQNAGKLIIWTNHNLVLQLFSNNAWIKSRSDKISIQYIDVKKELESSIIKDSVIAEEQYQELVKYLILWKYGGFYLDNNLFLVRDLSNLYKFGLQFSQLQEKKEFLTFLWKNSPLASRILLTIDKTGLYGKDLVDFVMMNNIPKSEGATIHSMNLYQFSNEWFDPILNNVFPFN